MLYIADSGGTHEKGVPGHIWRHKVVYGRSLSPGDVIATCSNGFFDGFCVDSAGRIWTSAADGVHFLDASGRLIGKILIPEIVSIVCFGGAKLDRLFITATTSLYAV